MTQEEKPGPSYFFCRIGAHLIDLLVCFAIFYVVGMAVAARVGGLGGTGQFNVQGLPALAIFGVVAVAWFVYFVVTEGLLSRTFGKMVCQLKVVREGETSCGMKESLIRNLVRPADAFFFYVVGLVMLLTTRKQQRLGDMAAGTRVIVQKSSSLQMVGMIAVIAAIGGGIFGGLKIQTHARLTTQMTIQNLRLTEGEEGPAVKKSYGPGEDLYLAFDLADIPRDELGGENTVVRFEPLDPSGRPIVAPVDIRVTDRPPEGAGRETPIHFHLTLPIYAVGGEYSIRISAKDQLLAREAGETVPFSVVGPQVAAGIGFSVQDHVFLAEEKGPPLPEAVYPAGSKIRTRFNVVGFQVGDQNKVRLRLDLGVSSETGVKLLDQAGVVTIDHDFFYPPRYLPITTSVDVPPDIVTGRYRIQYIIHDDVAGSQISLEQPFIIR